MAQPYVGEIRMFAGNFAPAGWMFCDGQELPITENDTLFALIGTAYGGDGEETFRLPDLRSRLPIHQGSGFPLAQAAGVEEVTLTVQQVPSHNHAFLASQRTGLEVSPAGNLLAETTGGVFPYLEDAPSVAMSASTIGPTGGSQPHTNLQPYVCINFIISLYGEFPRFS